MVSWGLTREDDPETEVLDWLVVDENGRVDSNCVVIVYDAAADRFYEGSAGDIMPAKTYGPYGASELIGRTTYGGLKVMHVINNRTFD